jgi:hypothetical protein
MSIVLKSESLILLESSGTVQARNGIFYDYYSQRLLLASDGDTCNVAVMSQLHFRLYVLMVLVAEGRLSWDHQTDVATAGKYLCEDGGNICYLLRGPPDEADKNAAPISVSPDKLARLPTFFHPTSAFPQRQNIWPQL